MSIQAEIPSSEQIVKLISLADPGDLSEIVHTVTQRYAACFPDWEVTFLSYRKDPELGKQDIEAAFRLLIRCWGTSPSQKC